MSASKLPPQWETLPGFKQPEPAATLDEQCDEWLRANSWILGEVIRRCDLQANQGHSRISIKDVISSMRTDWRMTRGDRFAFNNNYPSRIARRVIDARPDLADFIELRRLTAA